VSSGPLTDSRAQQDAIGDGYFASLAPAKYMLLTTFTRDGKPVATSQRVVIDGDRAHFRTGHPTGPSRRLRDGGWVQVAPCSFLGFIRYGLPLDATARLLAGEEARTAAAKLTSKYPGRPRFLRRLFHRVLRRETAYYELRAYRAKRRAAA
jgi:PPOX class probable F420-dependent enzyme